MTQASWYPSFFDELEKIAYERIELSPQERAKEIAQFATLGAVGTPLIGMLANKASTGKWLPKDVPLRRYLPTGMAVGLTTGGLLPAARLSLSRQNLENARERVQAEREARALGPISETVFSRPHEVEKLTRF
jgi:hypothetical protein